MKWETWFYEAWTIFRWIHHRGAWKSEPLLRRFSTKRNAFQPNLAMRLAVWENLNSPHSEISLTESLSPAGRAPSISDSLLLNWHKYLPFTMCQLFQQCQRIRDSERVLFAGVYPRPVSTLRCASCLIAETCGVLCCGYTNSRWYSSPS